MKASKSLKELAALTEQLEGAKTDVVGLSLNSNDLINENAYMVDIIMEISAPDNGTSRFNIHSTETTISENDSLEISLTASVDSSPRSDDRDLREKSNGYDGSEDSKRFDGGATKGNRSKSSPKGEAKSTGTDGQQPEQTSHEETEDEEKTNSPEEETGDDNDERSRPVYKDPEWLADVYDPDLTFAEMTDRLGVDVTPQTVRNHMIEHGIHEPNSTANQEERDENTPFLGETSDADEVAVAITDDVELPDNITLSDVTEAVRTAKTLYDVQQELDIEREQTYHLLEELNLLELVYGRVSTAPVKSKTQQEIEQRIQEAVTDTVSAK